MKNNKSIEFNDTLQAFAYHFSNLDFSGIVNLLNINNCDGISIEEYITLLRETFNGLKKENINYLKPLFGFCNACQKECSGYVFLDQKSGFYINLILEIKNQKIENVTDCHNFKLEKDNSFLKEQIFINSKPDDSNITDGLPF